VSALLKITLLNENANFDQTYWFGNIDGTLDKNILLVYDVFRYHVWISKVQRVFPSAQLLVDRIISTFNTIFKIKPAIRKSFSNNNNLSGMLQVMG
jgi:glycogen debranching enzyme